MSKAGKLARNLLLIALFAVLLFRIAGLHLTAQGAMASLERGLRYGPSRIVLQTELDGRPYLLGRYGDYCSVVRLGRLGPFYRSAESSGIRRLETPFYASYLPGRDGTLLVPLAARRRALHRPGGRLFLYPDRGPALPPPLPRPAPPGAGGGVRRTGRAGLFGQPAPPFDGIIYHFMVSSVPKEDTAMRRRTAALLLALSLLSPAGRAAQPPVSRAQFIAALWTCEGAVPYDANSPFSDVGRDDDGATAISWAHDLGVIQGTGGGFFSPQRAITREEAAIVLRRYAAVLGRDTFYPDGPAACNEYEGISPWADDSLYWACGTGLMEWSPGGRLNPWGTLTQEQLTRLLDRFFDRAEPGL